MRTGPYNLPFRDCAQYSAGGAVDRAAYQAWIDAFASGIGRGKAVVILEPDSLGIIPYNTTIFGAADWCKPTVVDDTGNTVPAPGASADERYAQLRYAVDSILAKAPNASVYLDGTHSETGNALAAAYLWVKIPGESDGSCNRGIAGSTTDPEWGDTVDPAAGAWFPEQALELAKLATPPLF